MKISCDIVMDLLPLYHDEVCNQNSKKIIDEHLAECKSCKGVLEKMRDNTIDNFIKSERNDVVLHHAQAVKRKSLVVGISIAAVLAVPILVSLIVNLATGRALDWFFIVLTALMTLASVTVVPLVFEKERGLWTLSSFALSLTLLLLSSAIYSGGNWFLIAIIPVFFGLSILFTPYVISKLPLTGLMAHHKGFLAMVINTLFLYAVIAVSGFYLQDSTWLSYWQPALLITSVCLLFPWGVFLIIRYIESVPFVKAGLALIYSGLFLSLIEGVVYRIVEGALRFNLTSADLSDWNSYNAINANISLLILLASCIAGGILLIIGLLQNKKLTK